jgi:tetratricopeptide (TPR) repeat protein
MDENKNPESRYDVDEEEGATTVLRAMDAETEDEEEGATTVLRAEDMPPEDDDDTEGATTVLTGPEPAMMGAAPAPGAPQFEDKTQMLPPQGAPMGMPMGQMPNGPMGAPMGQMPNGPMGAPMGQMPNGPMGAPMGQMQNGPMGAPMGQMPNGSMGAPMGMMPNNGQMPPMNGGKPPKAPKPPKEKKPKAPKQPKVNKDGSLKKKKTGLIVAICVVVVLALGAGAYFLFFTPEKRYERKMDVAEKAMTDSNYEEAVTAYEAALGIFDDRVPAMNGLLSAQISAGESDGARENFTEFRTTITGFDADKVTENSEDIVTFYEYADDLYSDTDSLIDAYKEGYNLTNDNGLKKNLVTAYVDRADAMDNSDYENKIAAYGDALDLDSTNESALSGRKACAYAVLDDMMDAQQYDQAESFINTYADSMSDVDFSSYTEKIESERALMTARHDLMEQVISLMSASDYAGMMDVDGSDNASTVVANMDGDSYVYATDGYDSSYTGKAAGVYTYSTLLSSGYYFYYGDYENGVRSGQGTMFVKMDGYNQAYLVYEGAWSNDKPNGAGTETSVNEDAGDELVTVTRSGNLVDGLFDGEVTVSLVSNDEEYGGTYTGTFTASNGDAPDIRENYPDLDFSDVSEDKTVYVVLECDGSPMYWHFSKGSAAKLGIHTFGN